MSPVLLPLRVKPMWGQPSPGSVVLTQQLSNNRSDRTSPSSHISVQRVSCLCTISQVTLLFVHLSWIQPSCELTLYTLRSAKTLNDGWFKDFDGSWFYLKRTSTWMPGLLKCAYDPYDEVFMHLSMSDKYSMMSIYYFHGWFKSWYVSSFSPVFLMHYHVFASQWCYKSTADATQAPDSTCWWVRLNGSSLHWSE